MATSPPSTHTHTLSVQTHAMRSTALLMLFSLLNLFRVNSWLKELEKVSTPICTSLGPMSNLDVTSLTNSSILSKLPCPTLPDLSSKNTMSALPWQPVSNNARTMLMIVLMTAVTLMVAVKMMVKISRGGDDDDDHGNNIIVVAILKLLFLTPLPKPVLLITASSRKD